MDASHFVKTPIEPFKAATVAKKWRCSVCGYIHDGSDPPDSCPVCSVPKEHFAPEETVQVGSDAVSKQTIVIIGAGVAGMTAAETAATAPGNRIVLISKEPGLPYFRLNLTRYLAGDVTAESLLMKAKSWFDDQGIELVEGDVTAIDTNAKTLHLRDGGAFTYDKLIITAGAHPFMPPIAGIDKAGIMPLRTKIDADRIIARAQNKARCVCIGGGLLGLETAGALLRRGCSVTVIEGFGWLLPRQLPQAAGTLLGRMLLDKGIRIFAQSCDQGVPGGRPCPRGIAR